MKLCSIQECGKKLYARGLCRTHYNRQWQKGRLSAWRAKNPEKAKAHRRTAYLAHRDEQQQKSKVWYDAHSEWVSVRSHWYYIFGKNPLAAYRGMPFCRGWNPKHLGGSWEAGAKWILDHIGPRPDKNYD